MEQALATDGHRYKERSLSCKRWFSFTG